MRLFFPSKKIQAANKVDDGQGGGEQNEDLNKYDNFEDEAKDAANLALAMNQGDESTNFELSLSCENLPKMDSFSLTDAMIVVRMEQEYDSIISEAGRLKKLGRLK